MVGAVRPAFPSAPASLRPLLGSLLLLLLVWGSGAPASADITVDNTNSSAANPYVINGPLTGMITVASNGWLNIVDGAMISSSAQQPTVLIQGGTVNVSGGSVANSSIGTGISIRSGTLNISGGSISSGSSGGDGVFVSGGTVTISGGSIAGNNDGVHITTGGSVIIAGAPVISGTQGGGVAAEAGMVTIYGGSLSGSLYGAIALGGSVAISGGSISGAADYSGPMSLSGGSISGRVDLTQGTLTISGCNLQLVDSQTSPTRLIGTLRDGSPINVLTSPQVTPQNLVNQDTGPLQLTCPANVVTPAASGACSASLNPGTATASDGCSTPPAVVGVRSDGAALTDPYPAGTTTITWTATDTLHGSTSCTQTITVTDTQNPTISCPGNITVPATSASGVAVNFTAGATDNCGVASLVCTNQNGQTVSSGATFPVGTTTVTCRATDAAGNQSTCSFTITVTVDADLSLTMSASPSPVVSGTNLTYTLVATNNGQQAAQGVVLTDPLPAGTSFVSASPSPNIGTLTTPKGNSSTVSWQVGTLASGQSVTLTLVVKASAKAGSTLTNTASISSSTPDSNGGNNSATATTLVAARR
jgi:uncharacterized repeat protein (TIGR01451 family)